MWYSCLAMEPQIEGAAPPASGNVFRDVFLPSVVILVVILVGIGTGWKISGSQVLGSGASNVSGNAAPGVVKKGTEIGSTDTKTFKDEAEGILQAGGVNGEGAYHLDRPGGESQTAALTSSVLDLDEFVGKKIHVWGESQKSTKAAWLMDVGKIKVIE